VDFIRHILGLRRLSNREEQIKAAFDEFIAAHPAFTATQVNFLRVLRSVVLRKAPVTAQDLQQPPFTRFGRDAASRLFDPPTLAEILDFANRVAVLPARQQPA
jgi:type I restriction enzyme R subunit